MPVQLLPTELRKAIEASDKRLEKSRKRRLFAMAIYATRFGSAGESDQPARPINLPRRIVRTLIPHLTPPSEVKVEPKVAALQTEAKKRELMLNKLFDEIHYRDTVRDLVFDALVGTFAMVRIGMMAGAETVKAGDRLFNKGQVFVQRIDLDDYILDPECRSRETARFEGEKYRVLRAEAIESGIFDAEAIEILKSCERLEQPRPDTIDASSKVERIPEMTDTIELIDLYVYDREGTTVVTMPAKAVGSDEQFLRVEPWGGPERGPMERLAFDTMPSNPFAVPVIADALEQDEMMTQLVDHWWQETLNTRNQPFYKRTTGGDDAMALEDAPAVGRFVGLDDPGNVGQLKLGGVTNEIKEAIDRVYAMFNQQGINPDVLSGMANSDTATENENQMAMVSVYISDMQRTLDQFEGRICRQVMATIEANPLFQMPLTVALDQGVMYDTQWSAEAREGDASEFMYTLKRRPEIAGSPAVKAAKITEGLQFAFEAVQMEIQTQGMVDSGAAIRSWFELNGLDSHAHIIRDPIAAQQQAELYGWMQPMQQGTPVPSGVNPGATYGARPAGRGAGGGAGAGARVSPAGPRGQQFPAMDAARSAMQPAYSGMGGAA